MYCMLWPPLGTWDSKSHYTKIHISLCHLHPAAHVLHLSVVESCGNTWGGGECTIIYVDVLSWMSLVCLVTLRTPLVPSWPRHHQICAPGLVRSERQPSSVSSCRGIDETVDTMDMYLYIHKPQPCPLPCPAPPPSHWSHDLSCPMAISKPS